MKVGKKKFIFLLIYLTVFLLYYPTISTYFCQDDFFHFKVASTDGSLGGLVYMLGFHPFAERKIAFYRPIFRDLLYNLFYFLFGLNHLPFRILALAIHFINIYLVFIFAQKFFRKKPLSYFAAFFYGIAACNVATLYYLAGGIQVLGATMFILLTLIIFLNYLKFNDVKFKNLSFITFLLAIATHEQAASLPLLLVGFIFIKYNFKKGVCKAIEIWPYFLVLAIYLYLEMSVIGYSSNELQYQAHLSIKRTVNSLMWYSGWAFGLPEMLIDFVPPGFKLDPRLMRYWGGYFKIIFPAFAIAAFLTIIVTIDLIIKKTKVLVDRRFWFLIVWYLLAIAPVIFLPFHKSGHYLTPGLPAFWMAIGFVVFSFFGEIGKKFKNKALVIIVLLVAALFVLSATSAILGRTTYWASARGKLAQKLIEDLTSKYPEIPRGSTIYFQNDPSYPDVSESWGGTSKQAYFALNNEDALQLYYKDPSLRVFYEDLGDIPSDIPSEKIYSITAFIN